MATGEALICKLKNIASIPGADNIVQANMFGETVIISKDYKEGDLGLLFDCESLVSEDYARENNLYRHSNLNKDTTKIGYLEDSRRIRAIKLRGIKCSAMFMQLSSLSYISKSYPKEGVQLKEWEGKPICDKYVRPIRGGGHKNNKQIKRVQHVLNFPENGDTEQLLKSLHKLEQDNPLIITAKIHGTSCRVGVLPCTPRNWFKKILHKIFKISNTYKFVVGSRHVLKWVDGSVVDKQSSFYKDDIWTESAYQYFYGKLQPSEIIFYEIAGFLPDGASIMPSHSNEKLKNFMEKEEYKNFIKKYGTETVFSYGCRKDHPTYVDNGHAGLVKKSEYKIFVYRIAMVTEQGTLLDLSWPQIKNRCEQLGVNHVPEIDIIWPQNVDIKDEQFWLNLTEKEYNHFPMHIDEGIVVRQDGKNLKPTILKSKKINFKILEGIIKDTQDFADLEESN